MATVGHHGGKPYIYVPVTRVFGNHYGSEKEKREDADKEK